VKGISFGGPCKNINIIEKATFTVPLQFSMISIVTKTLAVIGLLAIPVAYSYRIAVVNDIHGDLGYIPTSPTCISKTLPPLSPI
jgi:hypothetical protein